MILLEKSCFFSYIIDFLMGTWMLIKIWKYWYASNIGIPITKSITVHNNHQKLEAGLLSTRDTDWDKYLEDQLQAAQKFHCPLPPKPKGWISTESCWWWWRGAGGMLTIFPFWPTSRLRSQSGFAGMESMKRNTGHTQESMLNWHRLMHIHSSPHPPFFWGGGGNTTCLIYYCIRTVDYMSSLYQDYCCFSQNLINQLHLGLTDPVIALLVPDFSNH